MSSRGQVVIPKELREAAGVDEGDDLDVVFDGERFVLIPRVRRAEPARETGLDHVLSQAAKAHIRVDGLTQSQIWADRIRAVAAIKRGFPGLKPFTSAELEELLAESRRELEERGSRGESDE